MARKKDIEDSIKEIESSNDTHVEAAEDHDGLDAHVVNEPAVKPGKFAWLRTWKGALVGGALLLAVILAVPMTRYALLGFMVKKTATITVVDNSTGQPVTDATIHLGRADGKTDARGIATIANVPVGDHQLTIEKKNYEAASSNYLMPVIAAPTTAPVKLKATGRLLSVTVKNAISGDVVANATVKFGEVTATTGSNGIASLSLNVSPVKQSGDVTVNGYNTGTVNFDADRGDNQSIEASVVPAGKVYFLSNRTGTIDVMSSTIDGSAQDVILKGTGREIPYEAQLMTAPARDTLAYYARTDKLALYIIDTAAKTATKIDDSGTALGMIGWMGTNFYYTIYTEKNPAADGRTQLLVYNTVTKQRTVVDTTRVTGDPGNPLEESLSSRFQIANGRIFYAKCWTYVNYYGAALSQKISFVSVSDGKATVMKTVDQTKPAYCDILIKKPNLVYFKVTNPNDYKDVQYFSYERGKTVVSATLSEADFVSESPTFMTSPNGEKVMWTETRDGKQVSFVADSSGANTTQVSTATYSSYGWFGDQYTLYTKGNSELFVAPAGKSFDGAHKVTDYFNQRMLGVID